MKIRLAVPLTLALFMTHPALAQRPGGEHQEGVHGNQGHIPQAPPKREARAKPEIDRREGGRINSIPHVANDHWYGHDRPNERRYVLAHPFEHGHFERFGPSYRYHVERFDRDHHRFWFPGGFSFEIATWDWPVAAAWCWDCGGDNFVVYDDPDHPGWYLLYNVHTGEYAHVTYSGS
jgi:hypothetical protein